MCVSPESELSLEAVRLYHREVRGWGWEGAGPLHLEAFKARAEMDAGWVLLGILPRFWRPVIF